MAADDQLMNDKTLLDSLAKHRSTANIKDSAYIYLDRVKTCRQFNG